MTPICHRLMAAYWSTPDPKRAVLTHEINACIGSRCALWCSTSEPVTHTTPGGSVSIVSMGDGHCADNMKADPWPDPAQETK